MKFEYIFEYHIRKNHGHQSVEDRLRVVGCGLLRLVGVPRMHVHQHDPESVDVVPDSRPTQKSQLPLIMGGPVVGHTREIVAKWRTRCARCLGRAGQDVPCAGESIALRCEEVAPAAFGLSTAKEYFEFCRPGRAGHPITLGHSLSGAVDDSELIEPERGNFVKTLRYGHRCFAPGCEFIH